MMTPTEFYVRLAIGFAIFISGFIVGGTFGLILLVVGLGVVTHDVIDAMRQIRKAKKIQAQRQARGARP